MLYPSLYNDDWLRKLAKDAFTPGGAKRRLPSSIGNVDGVRMSIMPNTEIFFPARDIAPSGNEEEFVLLEAELTDNATTASDESLDRSPDTWTDAFELGTAT